MISSRININSTNLEKVIHDVFYKKNYNLKGSDSFGYASEWMMFSECGSCLVVKGFNGLWVLG